MANIVADRDPELEAEEKVEEEKLPEVEDVGAAAIESGFATGAADWEAPAAGFAGATGEWSADPAAASGWDAAAAPPAQATEWGAEPAKEAGQW